MPMNATKEYSNAQQFKICKIMQLKVCKVMKISKFVSFPNMHICAISKHTN